MIDLIVFEKLIFQFFCAKLLRKAKWSEIQHKTAVSLAK